MLLYIRKIITIILFMFGMVTPALSSTRGDVQIIEAAENIQYISQKIAIDYFFYFNKERNLNSKKKLNKNIKKLEYYIAEILNRTNNEQTKDLLDYFTYRIEEIKVLVDEEITEENARILLTHSEGFLEGAESIIEEHKYAFSEEEEMLMLSKKAQYLLEKVITYYMASKIGLNSTYIQMKMQESIVEIDDAMNKINTYKYSLRLQKKVEKVSAIWAVNKMFFNNSKGKTYPYLLLNSTEYTKKILVDIEKYHKKNL